MTPVMIPPGVRGLSVYGASDGTPLALSGGMTEPRPTPEPPPPVAPIDEPPKPYSPPPSAPPTNPPMPPIGDPPLPPLEEPPSPRREPPRRDDPDHSTSSASMRPPQ
jgi:hypothetical protein